MSRANIQVANIKPRFTHMGTRVTVKHVALTDIQTGEVVCEEHIVLETPALAIAADQYQTVKPHHEMVLA